MVKLRTLSEAYNYIKEQDPDTALTPWAIRIMIVSGEVPCIKSGKKYLIDMDRLLDYLTGKTVQLKESEDERKLLPIPEKLYHR